MLLAIQFTTDLVLALLAISSTVGAGLYFARNRSSAGAAKDAATAWQLERNAAISRAERAEKKLNDTTVELAAARARTDLTAFETVMEQRHRLQMEEVRKGFLDLHDGQQAMVQALALIAERLQV